MKRYVYQFLILALLFAGSYAWSMGFLKKILHQRKGASQPQLQPSDTDPKPSKTTFQLIQVGGSDRDHPVDRVIAEVSYYDEPYHIEKIEQLPEGQRIYYRNGPIEIIPG